MQAIELLIEDKDLGDLYKSIKLYQYLKGDLQILSFLDAQVHRKLGDEISSELEEEVESIFNKLNFKVETKVSEPTGRDYEFDTAEIKRSIKEAIVSRKDMEIEYFTANRGNFRSFKIRPDQMSSTMLDAYDYKKGESRTFKLSRIKSALF